MDRTMYGKVDPGARNPYRCIREKGISPGCKCIELIALMRLYIENRLTNSVTE